MGTELHVEVFTRVGMRDAAAGVEFLKHYCDALPELAPQKYGLTEPLRGRFAVDRVEQVVAEAWDSPFLWERTRPRTRGIVFMCPSGRHSTVGIHYKERTGAPVDRIGQYVSAEARRLSADWAYVYAYHNLEGERPDYQEVVHSLRIGCGAPQLKKCFLDLPWANVFGPVYVEFFGREKLLSAPCFQTVELGDGYVYLQLTGNVPEDEPAYHECQAIKESVKRHLGSDAFYEREKGPSGPYRVPRFEVVGKP
jgi:hypothetical protein